MSKLLEPGYEGDSELTFALQSEFHKGFPLENLRPLLTSGNLHTQAAAAFLVAEISPRLSFNMNCVVAEIADLLDSKIAGIRFDAIEALLGCTTPADGAILGGVMLRLDDEHPGVRWRVTQFIRFAERWQLRLAVENAAALRPESAFPILLKAHGQHFKATTKGVRWLLDHPDALVRRFGGAVAVRPRYVVDEQFLAMAEGSDDAEVREIAASCYHSHLTPIYAVWSSALSRKGASSA
ncbi:hypothetical protein [Mesorhizobium sp. AA22]|uniref:hypothetical protein n=1 Tax=Mesorhizobium sp. AA22 TaxID=1854057 RepID=UPI0008014705|nr:hypothetical protein [Mesorhizobium sp. AA22]QIA22053.1 hypothetical protein A9K68_009805 [Mesorhizobium sp. AA22]